MRHEAGHKRSHSFGFAKDGAERFPGLAVPALERIERAIANLPRDRAGIRLHGIPILREILAPSGIVGVVAADVLGEASHPVRAILFNKTAAANWSLAWHQDRTIVVEQRRGAEGFGPQTTKGGLQHVAPPFALLERMITLRVHLDPVTADNAPLLVAPGSHACGKVLEAEIPAVVGRCGIVARHAKRGDIWLYATPILHASEAAERPRHRRVLQIDYAAPDLPHGLKWLGI